VKGFLKEAANTLKEQLKIQAMRSKLDQFVFVGPRRLYLFNSDGTCKTAPDGVVERPLRAMTARGPRVTLVRSDMVEEGTVIFPTVTLFENKEIKWQHVETLFDYGEFKALGQWRNSNIYGTISWELLT
jgi:hypothetical protein